MTTREAKHAVLLREWSMMVQQCQDSGLAVNEWCSQNSIGVSSYYYRLGQVRKYNGPPVKTTRCDYIPVG